MCTQEQLAAGAQGVSDRPFRVKTVNIPVKRPCKPPRPHKPVYNQSGTLKPRCVLIPLGSPTRVPKVVYRPKLPTFGWCVPEGVRDLGGYLGGYTGWVTPGSRTHPLRTLQVLRGPLRWCFWDPPRSKGACIGPGTRKAEPGTGRAGNARPTGPAGWYQAQRPPRSVPSHNQVQMAKRRDSR